MSENDLENLPYDPGERKKISEYPPNQRDEVRRKYVICQPRDHEFHKRLFTSKLRYSIHLGLISMTIGWNIV